MKQARHELLKAKWMEIIKEQRNSGLAVRKWCELNQISAPSLFYWSRVIRQDSLVKAGTLAVTSQHCFAEITPEFSGGSTAQTGVCAVIRFQGREFGNPQWRRPGNTEFSLKCHGAMGMKVQFPADVRIFIACGQTDMRKSIDGLTAMVSQHYQLDPFQNILFLFCGRRRDRLKALYWEGDGFLLLYKRLENGSFQWPRSQDEAREITPQQYRWLLEGLSVDQKKAIHPLEKKRVL